MEMERNKVYTSNPPKYGFKCPKCGAFEYSTTPEYNDEQPDAVPVSEARPVAEPKFKTGDHVWTKQPKELAGRTGYIKAFDEYKRECLVVYGKEVWIVPEADLELVDPETEEFVSPIERTAKAWQEMSDLMKKIHMQCEKERTKKQPEPSDDVLTEEKVYDYYQERSTTAGKRADQLAWMFIVMMTGGLISGHAFETFSVCASLAAVYMLLSVAQAVWQTFTSWLFKQQIKKMDVAPDDYPEWVGGGAWLFFWAKMITIASAVIYFVRAIFF